jgi:hypothetical protein
MSKERIPIGALVRVKCGNDHDGEYARIINHDGSKEYPNDSWIEFESGKKAPYGDYELVVVTDADLAHDEAVIRQRRDYLLCGNWSSIKRGENK